MHINQVKKVIRKRKAHAAWHYQQQQQPQIKQQQQHCKSYWMQFISRYTVGSHIHGFYQLFWPTMRLRMRLLWALALISAFTALIYITYLLGERHQRKHFQTIIADSRWPIWNIAFPVVIVCNKNRLNWSRLDEIITRYNISRAQRDLLERVLTGYDALQFGKFDVFDGLEGEHLGSLNHLNFTQIVSEMAWRCDELFAECSWQTMSRNCCDIFRPRRLPYGSCQAFNELEERPSAEVGSGTGLMARLRLNEKLHAPGNNQSKGFLLNIIEPGVWYDIPVEVLPDLNTDIAIKAVYHYYDEGTHSLHILQRKCVQDYEIDTEHFRTLEGIKYMMENCFAECQQLYLLRFCNCTVDLFYPPSNRAACQLKDLPCLAAHNHLMQNYEQPGEHPYVSVTETGLNCGCLHNCKSLTLVMDKRVQHPQPWSGPNRKLPKHPDNRSTLLNIFYKRPSILVYKTSLIYSWMDLIVSFGAICQLCLGCSIIGFLEVLYFGLIDVPHFYWRCYALRRFNRTIQ